MTTIANPLCNSDGSAGPEPLPGARLFHIYNSTEYLSTKHSSYFHVYEKLFGRYVGRPITFVEIGVLNGGSLAMWRKFFGPQARIVGIDLNPEARRWEADGFEIHIGNQASPEFWRRFFDQVGPIDVLLDDGGHTNVQQITTVMFAVDSTRDGGMVVVEDTHCSYLRDFGNPSRHSFVSFAKQVVDAVNARCPLVAAQVPRLGCAIASVHFFESIIAFEVDHRLCFRPERITNGGRSVDAKDFRYEGGLSQRVRELEAHIVPALSRVPFFWRAGSLFGAVHGLLARLDSWKLRRQVDSSIK